MNIIAQIRTDFQTKFGVPRQSGLVADLQAQIVFTPEYRNPDALRGIEGFSHLWLIWEFSKAKREAWSPTVRPPRLGSSARMGVFATRSPFRPNPIGLSCVRLERVELYTPQGPILHVLGADLMDGTPIFDIKPYLPYADAHPEAVGGYTDQLQSPLLEVNFPPQLLDKLPQRLQASVCGVLAQDPRPRYQHDPTRIYGMAFGGFDVRFTIDGQKLTVIEVEEIKK